MLTEMSLRSILNSIFLNDTEMLAQMLSFADLYQKEGMFCLWIGAAYPVVFVFKPELVEV